MIVEQETTQEVEEKRKFERLEKSLKIQFGRLENLPDDAPDQEGDLLDISAGGLCFQSSEAIAIDTQLILRLEFPGWLADGDKWVATKDWNDVGTVQIVGRVVWVAVSQVHPDRFNIGVSFAGIIS